MERPVTAISGASFFILRVAFHPIHHRHTDIDLFFDYWIFESHILIDQASFNGVGSQGGYVMNVKFFHDIGAMLFYGFDTDV
jgi:hypothetical protein